MYRVKIYGAGSIGNHLSHAARVLGWAVDLCDIDDAALTRTRTSIYPGRYGAWDEAIRLFNLEQVPKGGYDLICVGTPPDSHIPLALEALQERPKALLVEKPLCPPDLSGAQELADRAAEAGVPVFVGYDHVAGSASEKVASLLREGGLGPLVTMDVEFREHWGGIFAAHPWLSGPRQTYLGYWRRGGGACGEHSHAVNLWQHFARLAGAGRIREVSAVMDYAADGAAEYDRLALLNVRTEDGLLGRVVQDVVTSPSRKWARIQGQRGHIEWHCGYRPNADAVLWQLDDQQAQEHVVAKTRPDDFIRELSHIADMLAATSTGAAASPLALRHGLDTMLVIAAAHRSARSGRRVEIDYEPGVSADALSDA